ncbi:MAG: 4Fe-4S binding protein [Archaeoglobaceae archaeon]|nr:4Fe-4S binding protein [Archaeoglobaceae archaeon]MCX8152692.1 4Fe-4S binding protein [Archaeoglobaceae archaeon]MDW8013258.1 4Fe-4S binding protein [Archaeoglobaceae archaeon]
MKREIEIINGKFKYYQVVNGEVRELLYDYKWCNGCGICVFACPVNAIELGPVHDIAIGLDMPPVIIDHLKCAYCGICYSFCPYNAFEFKINGQKIEKINLPLSPVVYTYKYENCKECTLCYKVCPTKAIKRNVLIKRDDIPIKQQIKGKVTIDRKKCNLCGICAEFCGVFKMIEKIPSPNDPKPYSDILIDESKCDYCKLCEEVCPERAIEVDGKRIDFNLPKKIALVSIDQDLCSHCGYCEEVCPYKAAKTIKPMEGKLSTFEARMFRCDPVGCGACIKICKHNRVWYAKEKRVYFNEKYCIYCGACENSCPYDLILVERKNYFTKQKAMDEPWRSAWEKAVSRILNKERVKEPLKFIFEEEKKLFKLEFEEKVVKKELPEEVRKVFEAVKITLKNPRYRKALESGKVETFVRGVELALGKNKREKE